MGDVWTDALSGDSGGEAAPEAPTEQAAGTEPEVAPAGQAEVVEKEQVSDEPEPKGATAEDPPKDEQPIEAAEGQAQGSKDEPDIKRLGREYFFKVKEMGGEPAFRSASEIYSELQNPTRDKKPLADMLWRTNPQAYTDLGFEFHRAHKEDFYRKDFGATSVEIQEALDARRNGNTTAAPSQPRPAAPDAETARAEAWAADVLADADATEEEQSAARAIQAAKADREERDKKLTDLEGKVNKFDDAEKQREKADFQQKFDSINDRFYGDLTTFARDRLGELGLALNGADDPEKEFKEAIIGQVLDIDRLVREFDADQENAEAHKRIADNIGTLAKSLDADGVMGHIPYVKVWLDTRLQQKVAPFLKLLELSRARQLEEARERTERLDIDASSGHAAAEEVKVDPNNPWGSVTASPGQSVGR